MSSFWYPSLGDIMFGHDLLRCDLPRASAYLIMWVGCSSCLFFGTLTAGTCGRFNHLIIFLIIQSSFNCRGLGPGSRHKLNMQRREGRKKSWFSLTPWLVGKTWNGEVRKKKHTWAVMSWVGVGSTKPIHFKGLKLPYTGPEWDRRKREKWSSKYLVSKNIIFTWFCKHWNSCTNLKWKVCFTIFLEKQNLWGSNADGANIKVVKLTKYIKLLHFPK
jgi:hypothetical protein